MHAASGARLGDAHPRQEGPTDLRLVPPALAAWGTAALMVHASPGWVTGVVVVCLVVGLALLVPWQRQGQRQRQEQEQERRHGHEQGRGWVRREAGAGAWTKASVAAVLLCAGAAAASAGLHGADLRRGPVPALAEQYARVTADVELTSDPRLTRPRIKGNHAAPAAVLLQAEVRRVQSPDGTVVDTRTPVLVMVDVAGRSGRASWLSLLPSTRVRVVAQVVPAMVGGDRVAAVLRVRGGGAPVVPAEASAVQRLAGRLRAGLREATDGLDADARALLPGFVVGDTSRVPAELDEAFKATDLTHLLAVSGANFTILLALFIGPPGLAQRAERRGLAPRLGIPLRATALAGGVLTLGFVIVCRPDPSVVRAAACGSIALLAIATGRRRSLIPALATAVLLLVLYDPWLARSYGFLLSVLATGALLTLAPRWSAALQRRRVPPRPAEALAAAGAAQAVCAPVVAVLSAKVSLVAVPCNLLAEFAVAPATVLGFATLATAPVAMPVAEFLAWCASWPAGWIADIARTGASLPGAGVDWPGSWTGALLLVLVTVVVVLVGRRLISHPWLVGACLVAFLLVVVQPPPLTRVITGWPPPGWRLVMCDVGQGDATVLATGDGAGVVVDAGPDPVLVDRCLTALGISRIPLVVLTHFHADHVVGLPGVLRGRSVGAIAATGFEEPADQAEFVRREAAARRIPLTRAVAGEERRTGSLTWRVLWPPGDAAAPDGPNDASVTMLVRSAGLTLLLLGDLEPPGQRELARSQEAAALGAVDVVKVAHHGSAYQDPGLIRAMAPRLALISVGADNPYGHPAPSTVAALQAGGAMVLRTDEDGAIAVAGTAKELLVARD
ncbi:ComEC/Rec2 family competence protein [Streptomyces europaeiscabiei]|uniref:ComEC/Rec2 family competence protein n=1 Tax=Streptomyces europaeiscabiei TaxID=146819 RepID=A0ABU4N9L9_9ACTN|nr:ComEC/Rec2 family competence protein [Streptomyces europaeiscabiei]MDX3541195.1 ComEC/Rec2 family competence protein [Streptomyces europaeiscabiei]MDX3551536.1 ComEC/Rec2 family competence protein [Streptomyces europaeiscabiei]MDX3699775.1 ComEC/Rec2 family competence protein [Streptomyces europaeiscabiei]